MEIGVTKVLCTVGKSQLHRTGHQVDVVAGILAHRGQVVTLQHVQHLNQQYTPGTRWWHCHYLVAPVVSNYGLPPLDLVTRQVQFRDDTISGFFNLFGNGPNRQNLPIVVLHQAQGLREILLLQLPAKRW